MSEKFTPYETARGEAERFAIRKIKECGPQLAEEYPEIVEDARKGMKFAEIAEKYHVADKYGVNDKIALSIVREALQTLLSQEERKAIYEPRLTEVRRRTGSKTKEQGIGLFGRSPEKRVADSKQSSARAKEMGVGIFAMTREQLQSAGRRGAEVIKSNSWFSDPIIDGMSSGQYALYLYEQPEYRRGPDDRFAGSPDYTKIMNAVNSKYGKDFSREATKGFFENERVRRKKRGENVD